MIKRSFPKTFLVLAASTFLGLTGCSTDSNQRGEPALFKTKAEAEKAAGTFNCKGAHKMGDKWMPCESHKAHEKPSKDSHHPGHHNH